MIGDVVVYFMKLRDKNAGWRPATSPLKPSPAHRLLKKLEALRETPEEDRWPDWPDAQAFEDARAFVLRLPLTSIPLPDIGLADDGEVNFLWKDGGVHVDLGFYGTHTFSYFAQGKDGRKIYGEEARVSEGLPAKIIALLVA